MKLEDKFKELTNKGEGAHMPHVYYGDPHEEFSLKLLETLVENGSDILEFGIPFSDPTADGPTFQGVCERALQNGITPNKCIEGIKKIRAKGIENPIVVTTYYNIPYVMGVGKFLNKIKEAGAQAIIVPNVPVEEADVLLTEGKKTGIHPIFQVAPTTTEDRLKKIADIASGFLYVIGVEGVTGVRESIGDSTFKLVERVRKHTDMPLLAGFGISTKEQAANVVAAGADGAIAGSVYAKVYEKNLETPVKTLPEIAKLVTQIKKGCIEGYKQRKI
ncbi:MAG: tryptophan synthase subunit alpha [Candidatus Bathyarchaeota archaeon]|nr:tryptophan synthase subunit alpha [Candidatus Bathyarchaeum tardum]WGM89675.1 MAG: tryptophan synthase subunit alpha [Candidatus Bathyarchaeum tardum]WNZ30225.1 MAG: tryptophan synthase subunit alpha [Candidatus Bathyarchaeota archaeon]